MAVTNMENMINPEVMGDMIDAKIEAMLKITPYAKVDTSLQGVAGDTKTVPSWNYDTRQRSRATSARSSA